MRGQSLELEPQPHSNAHAHAHALLREDFEELCAAESVMMLCLSVVRLSLRGLIATDARLKDSFL